MAIYFKKKKISSEEKCLSEKKNQVKFHIIINYLYIVKINQKRLREIIKGEIYILL